MSKLKILFMGTPDFSVNVLKGLIENYDVIGVVTQPDKEVGRKHEIKFSPVKEVALNNDIHVFQPIKIKEDYQELLNSQYTNDYIEKLWFNQNDAFQSLYYMNNRFNQDEFIQKINHIFKDQDCGHVMRVKGFYQKEKHWYEINMTQGNTSIQEMNQGQDVIIVIGEELNKNKIDQYFK